MDESRNDPVDIRRKIHVFFPLTVELPFMGTGFWWHSRFGWIRLTSTFIRVEIYRKFQLIQDLQKCSLRLPRDFSY